MTTNNTIIRKSATARFGWEWVEISEDGTEVVKALNKKTTDDYLHLPENPFNRRLIGLNFLAKQGDEWVVTYRDAAPRTTSGTTSSTPHKGLEEYLEGEDRELYLALVEKAKKNRDAVKNDPIAKAKAKYEAAQKYYESLLAKEAEA